jgi:S1-C subfamily serine protease
VRILELNAKGPAARAGVQRGDILVSLDGTTLASLTDLQRALDAERIGKDTLLTLVRRGERVTLSIRPVESA